jgi:REP element-mobilizing transposase RayT
VFIKHILYFFGEYTHMTSPRSSKIDLTVTPYYHCMTRCVRRTFLCGKDVQTGRNYSHRKGWIVNRIKQLANIFAIKICAYAVMSNHYHLVLFVNEAQASSWGEEEVLSRWERLFPSDAKALRESTLPLAAIQQRLCILRERLTNISWFLRCLNEVIARLANQEEGLSGRFWEGRFKSQALLDEGAVLAAMAYVDLNPIRAKIAQTPEDSEFTSIYERIKEISETIKQKKFSSEEIQMNQPTDLMRLGCFKSSDKASLPTIDFSLMDYLELVDTTGRILRENKKGTIPNSLMPILFRLRLTPRGWFDMTTHLEDKFSDAIGSSKSLSDFKNHCKKFSQKGLATAKQYYLQDVA